MADEVLVVVEDEEADSLAPAVLSGHSCQSSSLLGIRKSSHRLRAHLKQAEATRSG